MNIEPDQTPSIDPHFDGHLAKPMADMTTEERLEWAWEMMLLLHWARDEVKRGESPRSQSEDPDGHGCGQ